MTDIVVFSSIALLLISNFATFLLTKRKYVNIIKSAYIDKGTGKFGVYEHESLRGIIIEVEELETAVDKTKIRIVNVFGDKNSNMVNSFLHPINCISWVSTKFIKWNNNSTQMVRNKKLDEIISS